MGQKDQVAALNWVHLTIQLYGGDAPRITVAGQSAGGYINSNLANLITIKRYGNISVAANSACALGYSASMDISSDVSQYGNPISCWSNDSLSHSGTAGIEKYQNVPYLYISTKNSGLASATVVYCKTTTSI